MKKLVTVSNKDIIASLDSYEDVTLLYPLKDFCVGYELEFDISLVNDYILVNRIMDDNDLDKLEEVLKKNTNIKGILFDDLGVIDVVKDMNITKILLLDHLGTNSVSINYYLDYVDSVVVANDLTEDEIRTIVSKANKPLVVNVFGLKTLMYSRRLLLSNYEEFYHLKRNNNVDAKINDKGFKIIENAYGTKFYASKYYNALRLLDLDNVLYFWYDPILLDKEKILKCVLDNDVSLIDTDVLFLDKPTYYKVGDSDA